MNAKDRLDHTAPAHAGGCQTSPGEAPGDGARALARAVVRERAVVIPPLGRPAAPWGARPRREARGATTARGQARPAEAPEGGGAANLSPWRCWGWRPSSSSSRDPRFSSPGGTSSRHQSRGALSWIRSARASAAPPGASAALRCPSGSGASEMVGTAFLVAPATLMTNRHVVASSSAGRRGRGRSGAGCSPGSTSCASRTRAGVAQFEITRRSGCTTIWPLLLCRAPAGTARRSRIRWPWRRPRRRSPWAARSISSATRCPVRPGRRHRGDPGHLRDDFDVKRLQPGQHDRVLDGASALEHDCSTLGGNSGSPLVDLETNLVIGLHFGGTTRWANYAVALWKLVDDPLLKSAGVGSSRT